MREVSQADTPSMFGGEKNPPVYVYDCSGPVHRPGGEDRHPLRPAGAARAVDSSDANDTELLDGPSSRYGKERLADPKLAELRFNLKRNPRKGQEQRHADALRAQGHHHAGDGIHRHAREPAARARTSRA